MLASLSPSRRRFVLAGLALAVIAGVVVAAIAWRAGRSTVHPVSQTSLGPVLVIPGYGGSTTALQPLLRALRAEGRRTVLVDPPGDGTGDMRAQARHLGSVADRERARRGSQSVDVIGYSAGGVVARLWVRDFGGASIARRVLTLASPHHGTDVAALAQQATGSCPTACRQLDPDSDLLRGLNARDETPRGPVFVSVWSTTDAVVTPPESARLQGAVDYTIQSVCPDREVAHGEVPGDAVVLGSLPALIGTQAPVRPTRSDCAAFSS